MNERQLTIEPRFHGPPDSGNGGYVAGLVARALGGSGCAVTLRRPPPLGRALLLRAAEAEVALLDGDEVVASALRASLDLEVPAPPTLAEARGAEARYVGHSRHRFPACFVCGPQRSGGDGLRIFPGAVGERRVAASWTPGADLADEGAVRSEFLWAALDCPGYFAVEEQAGLALLGRMTAVIARPAPSGDPLIVSGWGIASEGRKHHVGTALHRADGKLVANARSTWITLEQ